MFERQWIWQPVTYMFLHAGITHILFNMLGIWMFGVELERMWGTRFFIRYYAITGIGAAITTLLVALLPFDFAAETYRAVTIGASGALYGLLLAFAIYFPNRPILMFLLFPIPAKYFVIIIGAISFLSATGGGGPTVAHAAHLGGHDLRVFLSQGRRRRPHGGDQIPLPEMEDEPAAPQVRRVLGRPLGLGP